MARESERNDVQPATSWVAGLLAKAYLRAFGAKTSFVLPGLCCRPPGGRAGASAPTAGQGLWVLVFAGACQGTAWAGLCLIHHHHLGGARAVEPELVRWAGRLLFTPSPRPLSAGAGFSNCFPSFFLHRDATQGVRRARAASGRPRFFLFLLFSPQAFNHRLGGWFSIPNAVPRPCSPRRSSIADGAGVHRATSQAFIHPTKTATSAYRGAEGAVARLFARTRAPASRSVAPRPLYKPSTIASTFDERRVRHEPRWWLAKASSLSGTVPRCLFLGDDPETTGANAENTTSRPRERRTRREPQNKRKKRKHHTPARETHTPRATARRVLCSPRPLFRSPHSHLLAREDAVTGRRDARELDVVGSDLLLHHLTRYNAM